jgi:hypothetical protein
VPDGARVGSVWRVRGRLISVLLVVLVACGGGDGDGQATTPATTPTTQAASIAAAVETTAATESVSLDMTVEFQGSSTVPEGTTIGMTGRSTLGDPRVAELHADFQALGVGDIEMLIDDQHLYMRGGAFDELLGSIGQKPKPEWLFVDLSSSDPSVGQFRSLSTGQNDASLLLYFLLGATGEVSEVGNEEVGGVATTHYSLTADLQKALDEAPAEVQAPLEENVGALEASGIETRLEAEVWIDDEQLIRRAAYVYELSDASGGGQILTTVSFSDFAEPVELDIPARADVIDVTELPRNAG